MRPRVREGSIALLAAACVSPFACTFLSDFPDVETEQPTTSSTSSGGAGGGGTSSSDASTSSTGSGTCTLPAPCEGGACLAPDVPSMLVATPLDTSPDENVAEVAGLAKMGDDVFALINHNTNIDGTPSTFSPEASYYFHSSSVARITPQRAFVARATECHTPNGYMYAAGFAASSNRLFFGTTSAGQTLNMAAPPRVVLSNAQASADCMMAVTGTNFEPGDLVPFLADLDASGAGTLRAATDGAAGNVNGVDAAYLAMAARDTTLAVLGIFAGTVPIFGETCPGSSCYFIATFDLAGGGSPHVDVLNVAPNGGIPSDLDSIAADVAIDEAGNVWAATTATIDLNRAVVYLRKNGENTGQTLQAGGASDSYGLSIATRGTRAYVTGFSEGAFTFGSFTPAARGARDSFVLAFDASGFTDPVWGFPETGAALPYAAEDPDIAADVDVLDAPGCEPAVFVTGCVGRNGGTCGTGADENELLLLRLDDNGTLVRGSQIAADAGSSLRGRRVLVDMNPAAPGVWIGMSARGRAFGFESTGAPGDYNALAMVGRFPL